MPLLEAVVRQAPEPARSPAVSQGRLRGEGGPRIQRRITPPNAFCSYDQGPPNLQVVPHSELQGLLGDSRERAHMPPHPRGWRDSLRIQVTLKPVPRLLSCFILQMRKLRPQGREMTCPGHPAMTWGGWAGTRVSDISPGQAASNHNTGSRGARGRGWGP